MAIELPEIISRYFAADADRGPDAVAECFTRDAVVRDEGNSYHGVGEIRAWRQGAASTYQYSVEPFSVADMGERIVVTSHLVGNFPGSPIDLRYRFLLSDGKIAELEIAP